MSDIVDSLKLFDDGDEEEGEVVVQKNKGSGDDKDGSSFSVKVCQGIYRRGKGS
jgi:hypothetical protein